MDKIELKSVLIKITSVKKKTKAHMLESLSVGDVIQLSIEAARVGMNRGRTYSPYIEIKNIKTGEITHKSFNEIGILYRTFDLEEVIN